MNAREEEPTMWSRLVRKKPNNHQSRPYTEANERT